MGVSLLLHGSVCPPGLAPVTPGGTGDGLGDKENSGQVGVLQEFHLLPRLLAHLCVVEEYSIFCSLGLFLFWEGNRETRPPKSRFKKKKPTTKQSVCLFVCLLVVGRISLTRSTSLLTVSLSVA